MKLFAVGWTAWRWTGTPGEIRIVNGAGAVRRVDADHAEGAALRMLRDTYPPERGWTLAVKAVEVPADLLGEESTPTLRETLGRWGDAIRAHPIDKG